MNIDLGMKLMKPSVCESEAKRLLGIYLGCQTLGRRYVSASVRLITDVQSLDPSRWSVKHPLARSVLSQPISRWLASVSAWPGLTCITSSPSRESQPHRKEVRSLKNMSGPLTSPGYYVPQKIHLTLLCVSGAARSAANCARLPGGPCTGRSRTVAAHTGETCGLPSTTGRDTKTRTGSRTWRTWRTFWRAAWNGSRTWSNLEHLWTWTGIRTRSTSVSLDIKWQRQQIPINKTWLPLWPWKYWNGLWVSTSFIKCRCESGKHPETTLLWIWSSVLVMGWWFGFLHIISLSEFKLVLQTRLDVIVTEVK